jgi:CheY-like chemotaxis protein
MGRSNPIRVLIVDDSALMRELIRGILSSDPEIEVVGAVCDPLAARQKIKECNPDVLTLDIEMPRMDGITFLDKIMTLRPMPVVMISSLTQEGAEATLTALEVGAVDFVAKPAINLQAGLEEKRAEIVAKVKAAAHARLQRRTPVSSSEGKSLLRLAANYSSTEKIVAIGASTGGWKRSTGSFSRCRPTLPLSSSLCICRKISPQASQSASTPHARSRSQKQAMANGFCRAMPMLRLEALTSALAGRGRTTFASFEARKG